MNPSDDDRIAYLAGDAVESLNAQDRAQLDELRDLLRTPATWIEPDPGLEDRVLAAVTEEARAAPAAPGERAEPPRPRRTRLRLGTIFRRPAIAFGGLASAVAAVLIVIVIATGGSSSPKPLHFAMVVSGTPLAAAAHGSASLTKTGSGWRIELSVRGLPHIENGRYYQAWLKNAAGILVPVGTFNDPTRVTLWSGVPVTKFRTLIVTLQRANGNQTFSGKSFLIGRLVPTG